MQDENIVKLSAYLDGELDKAESERMEKALATSATLQQELQRLQALRDWARRFPGRQPRHDVWPELENRIATRAVLYSRHKGVRHHTARRFASWLQFLPFYSSEHGWSNGAKRTAVFGLAGIAIAGMGRSFYQEQRANLFEEKNRVKDEQLVRATTEAVWQQTATDLRGQIGRRLTLNCPQNGTEGVIWGDGVYTDDSSICTAAVHAGLIEFETGGPVQIEIRPGQREYDGVARNDVRSHAYGAYDGSFVFLLKSGDVRFNFDFLFDSSFSDRPSRTTIGWDQDAETFRGLEGTIQTFECSAEGEVGVVWGSGPYTDDSSICTAAVHAGLITIDEGGTVTIVVGGKQPRFVGSEDHGIQTRDFGSWEGSFTFLTEESLPEGAPRVDVISWGETATQMRGWHDFRATMQCPPRGEQSVVWGSEPYTDDSSICTAAVHAGVITLGEGGVVTIEIGPGLSEYAGESRNGVESRSYGSWSGSFRFVR